MTSMAAEVVAPKVFEDLPHWDEDATWDDEMTVEKVVWDAELPLDFDLQGLLQLLAPGVGDEMQCEQSDVDVPVLFKCDGSRNVFDEVLSGVVWDEEAPSTEPVGNDEDVEMEEAPAAGGLLSANADYGDENVKLGEAGMEPLDIKIVVGEDRVDADQKQVPMQASVVWDIAVQELFDGVGEFRKTRHPRNVEFNKVLEACFSGAGNSRFSEARNLRSLEFTNVQSSGILIR
jgi:hypothetical protein